MELKTTDWGKGPFGEDVKLFTLVNKTGAAVSLTNYGATWVSAIVPDKNGKMDDVVLGFPDLQGYLKDSCYIGATIGRYANRIGDAKFTVDGMTYFIVANAGKHCLHGGYRGLSFKVWKSHEESDGVSFSTISYTTENGFPGDLEVNVRYRWSDDNKLTIEFKAETSMPTPVSLTNHAYFNLAGEGKILNQQLKINSEYYLPMVSGCIVCGKKNHVKGTPFDFTAFKAIGEDIDKDDEQLTLCKGYDESFVIKDVDDGLMQTVAEAFDPESGRSLAMRSTFPTVHLYTANFLSSELPGKKGVVYGEREAFCLEAQFSPNSPNLPDFPSTILRPGKVFNHVIEVQFGLR
ncbi:MAG: galactose mutarotase [Prevotellaceae bacterium]|jgi:aldose 1-epimerase|nr:galactose mutarotase [Prevotellaceae bacterium]